MKTHQWPQKDQFSVFIGIDQTGAVQKNGLPKPLPMAVIYKKNRKTLIFNNLVIDHLNHDSILKTLSHLIPNFLNEDVLICVDAAIGLPKELKKSPHYLLKKIKNYSHKEQCYGLKTAHSFFTQFLKTQIEPKRKVEVLAGANSVFKLHPFQKNIGCGSYRILKDLSLDDSWFNLWPFEYKQKQFTIAEGYPSFYWKSLLKSSSRNIEFLKKNFPNIHFKNKDHADSFVLAYAASQLYKKLTINDDFAFQEGWILGFPETKDVT